MTETPVYLFAALACEAKPLIAYFKLKKHTEISAFAIYSNGSITLTVAGVGKSAMAAGVAYTMALFPAKSLAVLVNLGVAGHKSHELGSLFCAEKIVDQDSARAYYPQLVADLSCASAVINTVSQAQLDYQSTALYDMEASAFYEAAIRFSSSELIQVLKVISDNENSSVDAITPAKVSQWIECHLTEIDGVIKSLQALTGNYATPETGQYAEIIQTWRFSSQQKLQLQRLLSRWQVLTEGEIIDLTQQETLSGKAVLVYVQEKIAAHAFGGFM